MADKSKGRKEPRKGPSMMSEKERQKAGKHGDPKELARKLAREKQVDKESNNRLNEGEK